MTPAKGYLFILGAAAFWGVSATIAKFLFAGHVIDTLVLVQMRMTLSGIVLIVFFALVRPHFLRVRMRDLPRFALLGIIGGAGSNFTYYYTIEQTNVSTAILLQYMAPLLVLAYAALSRDEALTPTKVIAGLVSLGGCYLAVAGGNVSVLQISRWGLVSGIASAFCWAFTNVWLRRLLKDYSVWTSLLYAFVFASLFWLFFNPPWAIAAASYSGEMWLIFFGFAIISILIPHSLYFNGLRFLTASRAIITATAEPIVAILSAFVLIHELLTPAQVAGAALVIVAILILQLRQERGEMVQEPAVASPLD